MNVQSNNLPFDLLPALRSNYLITDSMFNGERHRGETLYRKVLVEKLYKKVLVEKLYKKVLAEKLYKKVLVEKLYKKVLELTCN